MIHNPENLPRPGNGYRFLDRTELVRTPPPHDGMCKVVQLEYWADGRWHGYSWGDNEDLTYRTTLTREQLRQKRGL